MPDKITSETIRTLENRVSVRKFTSEPVSDELVDAILHAAYRAPTSSNIQAYSVVAVRDTDTLEQLSRVAGNQAHVRETPVFLAFCADLTRIDAALARHGHNLDDNNLEVGLVSTVDASLVGMSAYLAADSLGMKGVMIGAIRNDAMEAARILGLPRRAYCVFGMCLGWPAEAPAQKPRMDFDAVTHRERYGNRRGGISNEAALDDYDAALATHYTGEGRATAPDSWSHDMDRKFHPPLRDGLRRQLKNLGFDFR